MDNIIQYPGLPPYFTLFLVLAVGLALGLGVSGLSFLFGPKKPNPVKEEVYECGLPAKSTADHRFSIKFYLVAILFIFFDIETVFLYMWAVAFDSLGWFGLIEVAIFLFTLVVGYIYIIKRNALDWDSPL